MVLARLRRAILISSAMQNRALSRRSAAHGGLRRLFFLCIVATVQPVDDGSPERRQLVDCRRRYRPRPDFAAGLCCRTARLELELARDAEPERTAQARSAWGLARFCCCSFLIIMSYGLAGRGWCRGDAFIVSSIAIVVALIMLFVFLPECRRCCRQRSCPASLTQITDRSIWGLDCLYGLLRCGVAWNTVFLGILVGVGSTHDWARLRADRRAHELSGSEAVRPSLDSADHHAAFRDRSGADPDLRPQRCCLGGAGKLVRHSALALDLRTPGILIALLLAFGPIAFLVLRGVVQGISPALEEASQTLRASRWTTFRTITCR